MNVFYVLSTTNCHELSKCICSLLIIILLEIQCMYALCFYSVDFTSLSGKPCPAAADP